MSYDQVGYMSNSTVIKLQCPLILTVKRTAMDAELFILLENINCLYYEKMYG